MGNSSASLVSALCDRPTSRHAHFDRGGADNTTDRNCDPHQPYSAATARKPSPAGQWHTRRVSKATFTTYAYDTANRLSSTATPSGDYSSIPTRRLTYDADGNVRTEKDGNGDVTVTFGDYVLYDGSDLPMSESDADGNITSYTYDGQGNLATSTTPDGGVTGYSYDPASRLAGITYDDGTTPDVSYMYDYAGNRLQMTDGTGETDWHYNDLNHLTSYEDGAHNSMSYGYDPDGNVTDITYPTEPDGASTATITRTYDDMDRLHSVQDWFGHTTMFGYDHADNLTSESYPNETKAVFGYDDANRLTEIDDSVGTSPPFWTFGYTPDGNGRQTAATDPIAGTSDAYGYDQLGRLQCDSVSAAATRPPTPRTTPAI